MKGLPFFRNVPCQRTDRGGDTHHERLYSAWTVPGQVQQWACNLQQQKILRRFVLHLQIAVVFLSAIDNVFRI